MAVQTLPFRPLAAAGGLIIYFPGSTLDFPVPVYQRVFRRVDVPVSVAFRPRSGRVSLASGTQNSPFLNELSAYFARVSLVCKTGFLYLSHCQRVPPIFDKT